jgi:[acyl-carrier-protein] S-malonyltransferase
MPKVAFLFPGQGAQSVGMSRELVDSSPAARQTFDQASEILGFDLADVCFNGPEDRLNSTVVSQPAILTASWAALEQLRHEKPGLVASCQAAAGLSLGEYTALACADAITFKDALRVVKVRGQAMQGAADATPSGMASIVGLEQSQVEQLCAELRQQQGRIWIANLLGPGNIVVSGARSALEAIASKAEAAGASRVIPLAVAGAFHTEIMRPAVQHLTAILEQIKVQAPRMPVISNVDAQAHRDPAELSSKLAEQVVSPVQWESCVRKLLSDGFDQFYEIGPGRVLKGLIKRIDRKVQCENIG